MSQNPIDVSFVMTVYNKEYYLPSVLEALLHQTGLKNPEFIFVDDVSSDKSVEIIREKTKNIPNVKIITNEKNRGISVRINQGIKEAQGEYTRMLDSDDIFPCLLRRTSSVQVRLPFSSVFSLQPFSSSPSAISVSTLVWRVTLPESSRVM